MSPRDPARGRNGGRMTEVCCAGFVRFVTLRTGWLRSPFIVSCCPLAQHGASNLDATVNRQQKAANEAGCEQARFLSGVDMGKEWACVPKFGRSLATSGTQKVQPPALIRSPAKMGRYRCDKKANENGESYRPGPQNQQLNNQANEGATILFGR